MLMKKILLLFCFLFSLSLHAVTTINVTTAGMLTTLISDQDKATITNLTLTGNIDARDFKCIRDEMPLLEVLDMSTVTIDAFTGDGGTYDDFFNKKYLANEVPRSSFTIYGSRSLIKSLALPASLTSIGIAAIAHCSKLESITIPSGVKTIKDGAFSNCDKLTGITLPGSLTSIGTSAFENCLALTSVNIPSSVQSIGSSAFYYCPNLNTIYAYPAVPIDLSSSSTVFGGVNFHVLFVPSGSVDAYKAANQWRDLINVYDIATPVSKTIDVPTAGLLSSLLSADEKNILVTLTITGNIDARDVKCLRDEMQSVANIDLSAATIQPFNGSGGTNFNLDTDTYPANQMPVTSFEARFGSNKTLKTIKLPSTLTSIGSGAFEGCKNLTSVTIPAAVTSIGDAAFSTCYSLSSIYALSASPINIATSSDVFYGVENSTCTLYVSAGSKVAYQAADKWKDFTNMVEVTLLPVITTNVASSITTASTTSGGTISNAGASPVTMRGVCWSTTANPTISDYKTADGVGTGGFTSSITGLTSGLTYHIRAYATNSYGTSYGEDLTFATLGTAPTVTTTAVSLINTTTTTAGGNVTSEGSTPVAVRGVCWSTAANPTTSNSKTTDGSALGVFVSSITGLTSNTTYHIRAYATNSVGTSYGDDLTFKTLVNDPTVTIDVANAGALTTLISAADKATITNLTLTGSIDARDVKCLRDELTKLAVLDISAVTIDPYVDVDRTVGGTSNRTYPANEMPMYSFCFPDGTGKKTLTSIIFPNSITSIGSYSFKDCSGLINVIIPNSVVSIGDRAFYWCKFNNMIIGSSVKTIGSAAFWECINLVSIKIPASLTTLGNYAFGDLWELKEFIVDPDNLNFSSVNGILFNKNKTTLLLCPQNKNVLNYNIPNTVVTIGENAFEKSNLSSVTIPASLTTIGNEAFGGCTELKEFIVAPENTNFSTIDGNLYSKDKTALVVYAGGKTGNFIIPDNVTSIRAYAFYNCQYLTGITIGNSVNSIGSYAFGACWNLKAVSLLNTTPINLNSYYAVFYAVNQAKCGLYVPAGSKAAYQAAYIWKDFTNIVEGSLPTVSTNLISSITATTAIAGGNVISDGTSSVTARGICWNSTGFPTIADNKTVDGAGLGVFTSSLTGLLPTRTYYVRAYATSSVGTYYGDELTVTTLASPPTISTIIPSSISKTTAIAGGNITSAGTSPVTARGVCWGLNANPTTTDNVTNDGSGNGIFTSTLTGLTSGATYHIRAYATSIVGTSYGDDLIFSTLPTAATVTTSVTSSITLTTAVVGGNVTGSGTSSVTARGVCWSTAANPTTSDNTTTDGTGEGLFTSAITGLTSGVTYHYRAYVTTSVRTSYGTDLTFTTLSTAPTVTTTAASSVTSTTANTGGNVTNAGTSSVTARGVCWSITANPTIADNKTTDGTGAGLFSSSLTGLTSGVTYHIRAYATSDVGTSYGTDMTFTTLGTAPTVTTTAASSITNTTAISGGNVTNAGTASVTARGVCWSISANPTIADDITTDGAGIGAFSSSLTGLTSGLTYHIRAYATSAVGTSYGSDLTFTTLGTTPTVTTTAASSITNTTAISGGNVTNVGTSTVTARGICWSTTANPTTADNKTTDGTGVGVFSSTISGLTSAVTYHIRAYATSDVGTSYGTDMTFTTLGTAPTVTTTAASSITNTTAISGGNVTSVGTSTVTARGVCWSTTANPTTADNKTTDGVGAGVFSSSLTGLTSGLTYHIRAYATNDVGTSYGSDLTILTTTTGITDEKIELITLYPNPVSDALRIKGFEGNGSFSMTDINGRVIINKQIISDELIRISSLPKGIYIVKIVTSSGITEKKVIKN
jgi:hypothetical protein